MKMNFRLALYQHADTEDTMPVKLVGLYKNIEYMYDENQCYTNNKVIHDINLNFYSGNMLEYSP